MRVERVDLQLHHVRSSLPARQSHSLGVKLRHIAVHECGHAVVAVAIGCNIREIYIEPDFIAGSGAYISAARPLSSSLLVSMTLAGTWTASRTRWAALQQSR